MSTATTATPLTIDRNILLPLIGAALKVVPARHPNDILKSVRMRSSVDDPTLIELIATDGEITLTQALPDAAVGPVDALLPPARLSAILRECDGAVRIELTGDKIELSARRSRFTLHTSGDPAEMPQFSNAGTAQHNLRLPAQDLRHLLHCTSFACDSESTRYALSGVHLRVNDSAENTASPTLTAAATDSRRLSVVSANCSGESHTEDFPGAVLPLKAVRVLESLLPEDESTVAVTITDRSFTFVCGSVCLQARQVEGRFPKYEDIIPDRLPHAVPLLTDPFLRAIRQSRVCTSEETRGVHFTFSDRQLRLHSEAADIGNSAVNLPIYWPGDDVTLILDPKYVEDVLRAVPPETKLQFRFEDSDSPTLLKFDNGLKYIVMPISADN